MSLAGVWPQVLDFLGTPLVIEPSSGQLSGDAGLLPIRQFDEHIGLTWPFADSGAKTGRSSVARGLGTPNRQPCGVGFE
jgi:hypothetical protein